MVLREFQEEDFITDYDVVKSKKTILGYKSEMDSMSGAIMWYNPKHTGDTQEDCVLYATPSWDGDWGIIPFDGPDGDHFGKLDFTKSKYAGNKPLQLKLYFEAVKIAIVKLEKKYKK